MRVDCRCAYTDLHTGKSQCLIPSLKLRLTAYAKKSKIRYSDRDNLKRDFVTLENDRVVSVDFDICTFAGVYGDSIQLCSVDICANMQNDAAARRRYLAEFNTMQINADADRYPPIRRLVRDGRCSDEPAKVSR